MSTAPNAKVVVITGASAGVGRAPAIRFAQDGARRDVSNLYGSRSPSIHER